MKILLSLIGATIGISIMSMLPMNGGLSGAMKGIGLVIGFGCGMILHGLIEERAERERIRHELDKDRIKDKQETKEHDDFMSNYY